MKNGGRVFLFGVICLAMLSGCESKSTSKSPSEVTVKNIPYDIIEKTIFLPPQMESFRFVQKDPRKMVIVESAYKGDKAEITINLITYTITSHYPMSRRLFAGKLRLHYARLPDEWELREVENLTFKEHPWGAEIDFPKKKAE
jgi:hypothetical protein